MKKSTSSAGLPISVGPAFLRRTTIAATITGAVIAIAAAARWGTLAGTGFAAGLAWALANFWALAWLLRAATGGAPRGRVPALVLLKFFLYAVGIGVLIKGWLPPLALVAGFSWLLTTLLLRAAGAMWITGNRTDA